MATFLELLGEGKTMVEERPTVGKTFLELLEEEPAEKSELKPVSLREELPPMPDIENMLISKSLKLPRGAEIGVPKLGAKRVEFKPELTEAIYAEKATEEKPVLRQLSRFVRGAAKTALPGFPTETEGLAGLAGEATGYIAPFKLIGGIPAFAGLVKKAAATKSLPFKALLSSIRGAGEFATYETAKQVLQPKTAKEKAEAIGEAALVGGVAGPAFEVLPVAIGAVISKIKAGKGLSVAETKIAGEVVKNKSMLEELRKTQPADDVEKLEEWFVKKEAYAKPEKPLEAKIIEDPLHKLDEPEIAKRIQAEANIMANELSGGEAPQLIKYFDETGGVAFEKYKRTKSTNPEWFTNLGKSKEDTYKAIEKIRKDAGADKGATVEKVKQLIYDRLTGGIRDKKLYPLPPDEEFLGTLAKAKSYEDFLRVIETPEIPAPKSVKSEGEIKTFYRGENGSKGSNYFTEDKEFANEFNSINNYDINKLSEIKIPTGKIFRPNILPEAINEKQLTKAIIEARQKGYSAVYVDEGSPFGTPVESVFVFDKKGVVPERGKTGLKFLPGQKAALKDLSGVVFGIEPVYDDDGKVKGYRYNVGKGVLGIAGMGTIRALGGAKLGITPEKPAERKAFNVKFFRIGEAPKEAIETAAKELRAISNKPYKPISREEIISAAKQSEILRSTISREQTVKMEAALLRTEQHLAELAKGKGVSKEFIDTLKIIDSYRAEYGRNLQSLQTQIDPELAVDKISIIKELARLGIETDKIIKAAEGVDFNNLNEVTKFYRKFVKPTLPELIDEYRYINLLSSPRTHIINAFSNIVQATITAPATKLAHGAVDAIGSALTGQPRKAYAAEVPAYYKGMVNAIPEAVQGALKSLRGQTPIYRPDVKQIPTGAKWLQPFKIIPQALEASDILFRTMIKGGEREAGTIKALKQGKELTDVLRAEIEDQAEKKASYYVFRQALDPANKTGQGKVLAAIDKGTAAVYNLRKVPGVKWFVPFVQTPMNILKQGIEYSPLGLSTLPGAVNKSEQLAKAMVGSTVMMGAGYFALTGNSTWAAPKGEREKEIFYASGRKPYSIKVGDQWVGYSKLGPLAYPVAMATAIKWYLDENPKASTEAAEKKMLNVLSSISGFFADQSYVQGMNNFLQLLAGDPYALTEALSNVPGQLVPLASLQRWGSHIIDPVYRRPEKGFSLKKVIQDITSDIPVLSQTVPPIMGPDGEPSRRAHPLLNAVSPFDISPAKPEYETALQDVRAAQRIRAEKGQKNIEQEKSIKQYLDRIKSMPKEQRQTELEKLSEADYKLLTDFAKNEKAEPLEETVRGLGTKNGARAEFIVEKLRQLALGERSAMMKQLDKAGLITDDVFEQMGRLWKKEVRGR